MANLIHIKTSVPTVDSNGRRMRRWLLETSIIPSTPSPPETSNKGNNQTGSKENTNQCNTRTGYNTNSKRTQS